MKHLGVEIEVKDWIVKKKFEELGKRGGYTTQVFAILRETEKAMYVMLATTTSTFCLWVPKSQILVTREQDIKAGEPFHNVIDATASPYEEVLEAYKREMSNFI